MSLNMYLGEVRTQTQSMNALCVATIQGMEQAINSIDAFVFDAVLQGEAYESAKSFFAQTFRPLAQGIIYLCEELIRQNNAFPNDFQSQVASTDVIEQEILEQIREIDRMIVGMEVISANMPGTQAMIQIYYAMKQKLQKKLEHLYEFNYTSSSNYDTALQLATSIAQGLTEVQNGKGFNSASGTFSTQGLNMEWTASIQKFTEDKARTTDNLIEEEVTDGSVNEASEIINNSYAFTKLNSEANTSINPDNHFVFKESGAVVGDPGEKSSVFAQALKYETDIQLPKDMNTFVYDVKSFNKIGGEAKGAVVDAGFEVEGFTVHEQLLSTEAKAQFGGGIGGEAKVGVTFNDFGVDHEYGKAHVKVGNAEAGVEAKDGHIGAGAKADLVKGEAEVKVSIPFTDWKVVVGGEAAYGSIGAEVQLGLMNEIDVGLGIGLGVKFGVEKE